MRRIGGHRVGMAQGEVLISDVETDGPLWGGAGRRERRARVSFGERFRDAPLVQVSLTMWDIANAANARADVRAEEVTETGFAVALRTWGDTRIARVRVGWLAIGAAPADEDDWEVG